MGQQFGGVVEGSAIVEICSQSGRYSKILHKADFSQAVTNIISEYCGNSRYCVCQTKDLRDAVNMWRQDQVDTME